MDGIVSAAVWWAVVIGSFAILWFLALFMLLPVGLSDDDDPPGVFVPGAPAKPKAPPRVSLKTKFLWATGISGALWLVLAALEIAGVYHI